MLARAPRRLTPHGNDARLCAQGPRDDFRAERNLRRRSPLHGVPAGIKDMIDTADMPPEYNSPIYRDHRPRCRRRMFVVDSIFASHNKNNPPGNPS